MAYSKTTWENLPSTNTPLNESNLNKIENELDKLDPSTSYTTATGNYTTAEWSEGTNTCTWTAPKTGLYIIWAYFILENDTNANIYKQIQLRGTSTRITDNRLLYQTSITSGGVAGLQGSMLVYATQGQTVIPYIHTPTANVAWDVKLTGLFLK